MRIITAVILLALCLIPTNSNAIWLNDPNDVWIDIYSVRVTTPGFLGMLEHQSDQVDSIEKCDQVISELESCIEFFKEKRSELKAQAEKEIYVSVWALWEAGKKLEYIHPTREEWLQVENRMLWWAEDGTICPQNFTKLIDKALEIERSQNETIKYSNDCTEFPLP